MDNFQRKYFENEPDETDFPGLLNFQSEIDDFRGDENVSSSLLGFNTSVNASVTTTLPPELTFTKQSLTFAIAYSMCFLVALVGNLTVFITLSRRRYRKSRISLMICHLSAADLVVTFFMIPLEIGWRITVQWLAGNLACKVFMFFRAFGLYLSSNILVCVSLDRYFAVIHPLKVNDARRRGKMMLLVAWIFSIIYAIPQTVVFQVQSHPEHPDYFQCVNFGSPISEIVYSLFCLSVMYFVPLIIICWVYCRILCEITSKMREPSQGVRKSMETEKQKGESQMRLRRSDMSSIERARSRTLRMTIIIVAVFILCWTPYVSMLLWYTFDRESAKLVDARIQEILFIMAVGNSCANPFVYGSYVVNLRKECCLCFSPQSYTASNRNKSNQKLARQSTGPRKPGSKPPGINVLFLRSVQSAVRDLLKVGSGNIRTSTTVASPGKVPITARRRNLGNSSSFPERLPLREMKMGSSESAVKITSHSNLRIPSPICSQTT